MLWLGLWFGLLAAPWVPAAEPALRYGVLASFPPYQRWPEGGSAGGADVELVRDWAARAGVGLETVRYTDFDALEADLAGGRIDLASSMARTPEREARLIFTRPYAQFPLALVTRTDQPSGALLPDLAGRSIAVVRGFASQSQADRLFPLAARLEVASVREGLEAVRIGRADTFLEAQPVVMELIARERIAGLQIARRLEAPSGRLHLALAPGRGELAERLSVLIADTEPMRVESLVEAWSVRWPDGLRGPFTLTAAERERLARWPAPVIGIVGREVPFAVPTADGAAEGLTVDVLLATLGRLGVQPGGWKLLAPGDVAAALGEGRIDLLLGLGESADRHATLRFVGPFIEYPTVLVGRPEGAAFDLDQLHGRRLALPPASAARTLVAARHPSITIVDCIDTADCIERVAGGEAEATLADVVTAVFLMARHGRADLQIIGSEPLLRRAHSIAVDARHSELVPLIGRALEATVDADLQALKERWLSRPVRSEALRAQAQRALPYALAGLALLALFVVWHVARLRREVLHTRQAQQQAERADQTSRRFVAFLAHEVRNSLHSIIAGAELALDPQARPGAVARTLGDSARSTLLLLNNLLDRDRLDGGRLVLRVGPAQVGPLVSAVVHEMRPAAQHRGLALQFRPPADDPVLQVDALRLQQILRNLLSNAIKYSDHGTVEVQLDMAAPAAPTPAPTRRVTLRVLDDGRSGPATPTQDAGAATGAASSSGIGLPLCHDLARLMDGKLVLRPRSGTGTEARLVFDAAAGTLDLPAAASHAPLRVLVVEDSTVYAMLLERAFVLEGHAVRLASSLAEALAALRSAPFDLLLSDLNLGDGSARDLLAALGATARSPGFSVVLMSAEVDDLGADDPLRQAVAAVLAKTGDARQMVALALQAARRG